MEASSLALVAGAGVLGGLVNALAGGGSLITFPAFLAVGLPPVTANATNALAAWPGHAAAAWAERQRLPALLRGRGREAALWVLGGAAGATLLLASGDRVFLALVPPLLGLATLLFALRRRLSAWGARHAALLAHPAPTLLLGCYGGYFGAGLGVMVSAWLAARLPADADAADVNLLKNALAALATSAGLVLLVLAGAIAWVPAAIGFVGALAGGWLGGRLARRLPPQVIAGAVIAAGGGLTLAWAWRIYL